MRRGMLLTRPRRKMRQERRQRRRMIEIDLMGCCGRAVIGVRHRVRKGGWFPSWPRRPDQITIAALLRIVLAGKPLGVS